MKIKQQTLGNVTVLSLWGNLTTELETMQLREAITSLLDQNVRKVVVDIGGIDRISSTGFGVIMSAMISLWTRDGELCVANPTEKTGPLFRVTKIVRILKLYETVEKAVASFR